MWLHVEVLILKVVKDYLQLIIHVYSCFRWLLSRVKVFVFIEFYFTTWDGKFMWISFSLAAIGVISWFCCVENFHMYATHFPRFFANLIFTCLKENLKIEPWQAILIVEKESHMPCLGTYRVGNVCWEDSDVKC